MVAALQHDLLPRTLHVEERSEEVDWSAGAVSLLTEEVPWLRNGRPRRAGVSSFGVSGTNAHVIIEEASGADEPRHAEGGARADQHSPSDVVAWVLSARGAGALRAHAERLRSFVASEEGVDVGDVGFSLAGRSTLEDRAVVLGGERDQLLAGLGTVSTGQTAPNVIEGVASTAGRSVAFLFTGQGAQRMGMGRELYQTFPAFRSALEEVSSELDAHLGRPLLEVLFADEDSPDALLLDETMFAQASLFAVEVSLLRLLEAWGVRPDYLIGHSIGELTAAFAAGVFSLGDACKLVAARGRLMGALPSGGAMVAVQASEEEALESLAGYEGRAALAAVNGPAAIVLSGDEDAVSELADMWGHRGRKVKRLRVSHAFHSPRMEGMLADFEEVASGVLYASPSISVVSNLTGEPATDELCSPEYWVRHVRETVRFADGIGWLAERGVSSFLEIGPDGVLSAMATECLRRPAVAPDAIQPTVVPALKAGRAETLSLISALGELWVGGMPVDWATIFGESSTGSVALPTYPFQRERYWLAGSADTRSSSETGAAADTRQADAAGSGFWEAVEREDLAGLLDTLRVEDDEQRLSLSALLPSLSAWRRRSRVQSQVSSWSYQIQWKPLVADSTRTLSGRWLVVAASFEEDRWITALLGALGDRGAQVVPVQFGEVTDSREDLTVRLRDAVEQQSEAGGFDGVISLLAFDERHHHAYRSVPEGLMTTATLVQALGDADVRAPLWLLTRGAVSVSATDTIHSPTEAQAWGMGMVVGLEYPERWGGVIDLPETFDERVGSLLVGALAGVGGEDQLAIRGAGTFVRRVVRMPPHEDTTEDAWRSPTGTVLVTGGTGGLGRHVADWLARCGAEHLLLLSRRGIDAPGATELRDRLTDMGAQITITACDVADREQLAALIESLPQDRPLKMVVHAAGMACNGAIDSLTPEDFEQTLSAKAQGALNLDALTEDLDLSAFVLFSSIAGVFGSGFQAPYAAANAYLDALAAQRRARGKCATSVAWGPWEGEGMATQEGAGEALRRRGLERIAPQLAIEALQGALCRGETLVTVADIRWDTYARLFTSARSRPLIEDLPEVRATLAAGSGVDERVAGRVLRERVREMSAEERRRLLLELVGVEVARVMGNASLETTDSKRAFKELGFDSLMAVELHSRLSAATGIELPATLVFDYPTPIAVVECLLAELAEDGGSASASVESGLIGLERSLIALTDDAERRRVTVRLRTLLAGLDDSERGRERGAITVVEQMQSASDEEIFDFIDRQLGSP
jgi:acyl transferase domain-containing protein/acyl carrier protein